VVLVALGISRYFDAVQRKRDRLEQWQWQQALLQAIRQAAAAQEMPPATRQAPLSTLN
jgi:hypothetical protein